MIEGQATKAQGLFDRFLRDAGISNAEAGRRLGASAPTILSWRRGDKRPEDFYRAKIERWTRDWERGPILSVMWRTADESNDIRAVRPFRPVRASGGPRRPRVASPAGDSERQVA